MIIQTKLWGHDEVENMLLYQANVIEKLPPVLPYSGGINASAALREKQADLCFAWPISRGYRRALSIFAMDGTSSRWTHATSINSASGNKPYVQEQDHEPGE
jgi:hypothetical protein